MYATARGVIRTAQIRITRNPCRAIGGAPHPFLYRCRTFHQSTTLHSVPNDEKPPKDDNVSELTPAEIEAALAKEDAKAQETKGEEDVKDTVKAGPPLKDNNASELTPAEIEAALAKEDAKAQETKGEEDVKDTVNAAPPPDLSALSQRLKAARAARAARANRQKQPEGLPPIRLPEWFWNQCVNPEPSTLRTYTPNKGEAEASPEEDGTYSIAKPIYDEISGAFKAALKLRPPKNHESNPPVRPSIVLQCPKDGGVYFLDSVVGQIATENQAHLIRINAHDIANIVGSYIDENLAWNLSTVALFGYNTQEQAGKMENYDKDSKSDSVANEAADDDESPGTLLNLGHLLDPAGAAKRIKGVIQSIRLNHGQKGSGRGGPPARFSLGAPQAGPFPIAFGRLENVGNMAEPPSSSSNSQSPWNDFKLTTALETLVNSADSAHAYDMKETTAGQQSSPETVDGLHSQPLGKLQLAWPRDLDERQAFLEKRHVRAKALSQVHSVETTESQSLAPDGPTEKPLNTIIQVTDYKELNAVTGGSHLLNRLQNIVNRKWQDGRNIVLVGTTSSSDPDGPIVEKNEIQLLQEDVSFGLTRTIYVPPERSEAQHERFVADEKHRIRSINIRHVGEMVDKLTEGSEHFQAKIGEYVSNALRGLDSAVVFTSGLEDAVWSYSSVYRFANAILGNTSMMGEEIDTPFIEGILKILSSSDDAKFQWGLEEMKKQFSESVPPEKVTLNAEDIARNDAKKKIDAVKRTCNKYEQSLLHGVVLPSNIKTTFDDIRAPRTTIEALKSLTSLSLLRPDAFSYGVLATEKISGLLLYGPPGTGKTLLAKAVAKESGATVLEVSSAELNAMFVGESEKNVRAVFSLARKLSPCVVFIDEVDSIFASREHSRNRTGSRALLNQFLRELDGLTDLSTFIMVATNRPFDLDDAVLRRLPRRLLVDLPTEKDREEILRIHLKNEELSPDVSLAMLAKDTPFYSGSDLKHVVVTAAINATLEENKLAALHTGDEPHKYPEKRILTHAHFAKALEEISASISEDMGSLTAIKKFDEKYGDRKGRRKKGPSMGFGGTKTIEKDSESARVRESVPIVEEPEA